MKRPTRGRKPAKAVVENLSKGKAQPTLWESRERFITAANEGLDRTSEEIESALDFLHATWRDLIDGTAQRNVGKTPARIRRARGTENVIESSETVRRVLFPVQESCKKPLDQSCKQISGANKKRKSNLTPEGTTAEQQQLEENFRHDDGHQRKRYKGDTSPQENVRQNAFDSANTRNARSGRDEGSSSDSTFESEEEEVGVARASNRLRQQIVADVPESSVPPSPASVTAEATEDSSIEMQSSEQDGETEWETVKENVKKPACSSVTRKESDKNVQVEERPTTSKPRATFDWEENIRRDRTASIPLSARQVRIPTLTKRFAASQIDEDDESWDVEADQLLETPKGFSSSAQSFHDPRSSTGTTIMTTPRHAFDEQEIPEEPTTAIMIPSVEHSDRENLEKSFLSSHEAPPPLDFGETPSDSFSHDNAPAERGQEAHGSSFASALAGSLAKVKQGLQKLAEKKRASELRSSSSLSRSSSTRTTEVTYSMASTVSLSDAPRPLKNTYSDPLPPSLLKETSTSTYRASNIGTILENTFHDSPHRTLQEDLPIRDLEVNQTPLSNTRLPIDSLSTIKPSKNNRTSDCAYSASSTASDRDLKSSTSGIDQSFEDAEPQWLLSDESMELDEEESDILPTPRPNRFAPAVKEDSTSPEDRTVATPEHGTKDVFSPFATDTEKYVEADSELDHTPQPKSGLAKRRTVLSESDDNEEHSMSCDSDSNNADEQYPGETPRPVARHTKSSSPTPSHDDLEPDRDNESGDHEGDTSNGSIITATSSLEHNAPDLDQPSGIRGDHSNMEIEIPQMTQAGSSTSAIPRTVSKIANSTKKPVTASKMASATVDRSKQAIQKRQAEEQRRKEEYQRREEETARRLEAAKQERKQEEEAQKRKRAERAQQAAERRLLESKNGKPRVEEPKPAPAVKARSAIPTTYNSKLPSSKVNGDLARSENTVLESHEVSICLCAPVHM
ncbi:hypothetical protein DFS34DRAFT_111104 [Phlyctochytrium arcticum]|nr:hypothetical protein DFS34DRAFT_111104 [Phlyctochytrium arcticum]